MNYYRITGDEIPTQEFDGNDISELSKYLRFTDCVWGDHVLVDLFALSVSHWICNRFACTSALSGYSVGTCCDGGGIVSYRTSKIIETYYEEIFEVLPKQNIEILKNVGMLDYRNKLRVINDECIFLSHKNNDRFCSLHYVAEKNKIPVFMIKSFDCCIAPLDIIWLDNSFLFLTASIPQNRSIVRWRWELPCVECDDRGGSELPPVYESLREIITVIFGMSFYDRMVQEIMEYQLSGKAARLSEKKPDAE